MSAHLQRGLLLLQQQRADLAAEELRLAIAEEPQHYYAHALMALCLRRQEKFDEATAEVQQAIGLAPDVGFPYYVLANVMEARNRSAEAKAAIAEAIRLEPDEPDFFGQLAIIEFSLRDWNGALAAAENGLKIDPEHVNCTNLRVQALTKLGRRTDADAAVEAALRRTPDDAYTHANRGWTLLEQRNPAKAMEHFREALRLNPELEWARMGIVEALKSQHFIYRWMLAYFFWMARLSRKMQWGVIIGAAVLFNVVASLEAAHPGLSVITRPLVVAYLIFFVLSWLSLPMFNTVLRLNKFGRMVLSRRDVWQSNVVCALLFPALVFGIVYAFSDGMLSIYAQEAALGCGFTAIFASTAFLCADGWPRWTMVAGAVAFFSASATLIWKIRMGELALHQQFYQGPLESAIVWRENFVRPAAAVLLIAGNILAMKRPRR